MNVFDIYTALRKHIPAELAAEWDNEGIMLISDPKCAIDKALVTLDVTPSAVETAIKRGCGLIVSHHPVIFKPLKRLDSPKLNSLIKAGISVLSFHTSLDCADGGTADTLAALLGLTDISKLYDEGIPCGRLGKLNSPLSFNELALAVIKASNAERLDVLPLAGERKYTRIAVCPGEGKSLYNAALASGADAYVCGSMPYNDLCDASEHDMAVLTAGHFNTEQPVCINLANLLRELGIKSEIFQSNSVKHIQAEHSYEEN